MSDKPLADNAGGSRTLRDRNLDKEGWSETGRLVRNGSIFDR